MPELDKAVVGAVRAVIEAATAEDAEGITMGEVRKQAEARLKLKPGSLDPHKAKIKDLVQSVMKEQEEAAQAARPAKRNATDDGDGQPAKKPKGSVKTRQRDCMTKADFLRVAEDLPLKVGPHEATVLKR